MPDKSMVIAALECCILRHPDDKFSCPLCPYRDPNINCLNRLKMDALALIQGDGTDGECEACQIEPGQEGEADGV